MKLRKPFVLTVALAPIACGREGAPVVEAATTAPIPASASASASASAPAPASASAEPPRLGDYPVTKNAVDAQKRTIFRGSGDTCYVELPWGSDQKPGTSPRPRMPGEAPPTQNVACPPAMKTAAWATCSYGTIHAKRDDSACVCFRMGNPPYPPQRTACP